MPESLPLVLVADDEPVTLKILAAALDPDFTVRMARDGADALALARRPPYPDVVLLDVTMPGMDGYAVCAALKADPLTASIPVIFVTARTDAASETGALAAGAADFLHKPINPDVVRARVRLQHELVQHRQRLEELVRARTLELAQARDAAESANRAKTAFLDTISHEMLTPLNHIAGVNFMLGREIPPGRAQERLAAVNRDVRQLSALVVRVLDFANLEASGIELGRTDFDPRAILEETVGASQEQALAKGLALELEIAPSVPTPLRGDAQRLVQILAQLLDNAIKFSEAGRIRVSMETGTRAGSSIAVRFAVSDQGPGLPPDIAASGPRRFRPGDDSLTRSRPGLGLGLALCDRLIGLMGGELSLTSAPGQGTTAAFHVPLGIAEVRVSAPL